MGYPSPLAWPDVQERAVSIVAVEFAALEGVLAYFESVGGCCRFRPIPESLLGLLAVCLIQGQVDVAHLVASLAFLDAERLEVDL